MKDLIITISGLPGSGTTTAAKLLAERTGMELISTGEIFRELAKKKGFSLEEFSKEAERNEMIDRELDENLLEMAKPGRILEGRLTGHLLHREDIDAFKVWIHASQKIRALRIANRELEGVKEVYDKMIQREESEFLRYKKYYDIDLNDMAVYDMIINSNDNSPEEIVNKIIEDVEKWNM